MILENYLEQHEKIKVQVAVIQKLSLGNLQNNATQIGTEISRLAGVIQVHLSSEDKFMYPKIMTSGDENIKNKAITYQNEMGDLMEAFKAFKDKYNTKPRFLENEKTFQKDWMDIVKQLLRRIEREEKELYKHI